MFQLADKIICVSEKFCKYMKSERPDLEEKIDFVNNGIEKVEKIKTKNKINDIYTNISVGGGVKLKNNLTVCKAINEIKDIKIKFIVIGKLGKDGEKIKKYGFVEYYENLPHEEVLKKMRESDLYVQNSYIETFGLSIFEAIKEGCRILISSNVGIISILDNIKNTDIIYNNTDIEEIKNKIISLYNQKNIHNYITDANKYRWEKSAERLKERCKESEK